jgi:hypothetical protein
MASSRVERRRENLALPETKIFIEMVRQARGDKRGLFGIAYSLAHLGLPDSWMRERVTGRIRVKASDVEILKQVLLLAGDQPRPGHAVNPELVAFRKAVSKMCRECAPEPERRGAEPLCPEGLCPLRPVSPLQLSPRATKARPIVGKDWSR